MKANGHLTTSVSVPGRFIVGEMYLTAGTENLLQLEAKAGYTASKGVSNASFWVATASLLLLLGGGSLIIGIRPHIAVGALAAFLVSVTLVMHNFWMLTGIQTTLEFYLFMGSARLLGSALLFVAILHSAWIAGLSPGLPASQATSRKCWGSRRPSLMRDSPLFSEAH